MYGVISAKLIGGKGGKWGVRRPWVAKLFIEDGYAEYNREFIRPVYDYTNARGNGGRGSILYFNCPPGIYETHRPLSWTKEERVFCIVNEVGDVREVSREEALRCLRRSV